MIFYLQQNKFKIFHNHIMFNFLNSNLLIQILTIMKNLQNPTTYFFKQAENPPNPYKDQIAEFVNKLINTKACLLCKQDFDIHNRIPRILIHCGHTFCTQCLLNFYMYIVESLRNNRIRCPMCLKLVKHLDCIQRLPINHTIFTLLVERDKQNCQQIGKQPKIKDASKFLFSEFERVQKQAHKLENPPKVDPDSGLLFCAFHNDRVEHFYCTSHKIPGCRVCIQIGHTKPDCTVVDLYEVEDPTLFLKQQENPKNEKQKKGQKHIFDMDQQQLFDDQQNESGRQYFPDRTESLNSV